MIDYATIEQVARETRQWAMKANKKSRRFSKDLCGMCAIAAAELFERLIEAGVPARISANHDHCFVEVLDAAGRGGLIVDVTATQFGREPVLITRRAKLHGTDRGFWTALEKFDSVHALQAWQEEKFWPLEQIATAK